MTEPPAGDALRRTRPPTSEYAPLEGTALVARTGAVFVLGAGTLALVVLQA